MNRIPQQNYLALIQGVLITAGLINLISYGGLHYFIVNPDQVSTPVYTLINAIGFGLCSLLIAYLISKFSTWKVLGVLGLLVIAIIAEKHIHISNNPLTIPLIILFWLGVAYLIINEFFLKYKVGIIFVYGLVISYYLFAFVTASDFAVHRKDFANFLLAPLPVFGVLWIYEQWRWLSILKADKAKAELALLRSQINPHFFFNTLNNLYGLVIERSDKAPEVILKLSDMMRYTIYMGKEDLVPIQDEISYLKNYIELHKIRYQKKVEIVFTHDVQQDLKVAPLLYIILLENAFKHGVEKLRTNAYIHMHMESKQNKLCFRIENNFEESTSEKSPGIGLENLQKRLNHLYPNRHELIVEKEQSAYKVHLNLDLILCQNLN